MTTMDTEPRPGERAPSRSEQPPVDEATLFAAIRARPSRVILPIVGLSILALVVAILRPATYTAETRLTVGRIDVSTQAAPGVVEASKSLAGAYSRAIAADQVGVRIERELGDIEDPVDSLSASPIPDSPVIRLEAEASSAEGAIELTNAASRALIDYINDFNSNAQTGEELLQQYQDAQARVVRLASQAAVSGSASQQAELRAARLEADALEEAYRSSLDGDASGNDLQVLTRATEAKSDRRSVFQLLLFAAVVAGAGIGILRAYMDMNREMARGRTGLKSDNRKVDRGT